MTRIRYTENEAILCAYIALHGRALLNERKISTLYGRSESSIKMKVQNIAAMLDDHNIGRSADASALSGLPMGETGRDTDWPCVDAHIQQGKAEHWAKCKTIVSDALHQ